MHLPVQLVELLFGKFIFARRWRLPHSWPAQCHQQRSMMTMMVTIIMTIVQDDDKAITYLQRGGACHPLKKVNPRPGHNNLVWLCGLAGRLWGMRMGWITMVKVNGWTWGEHSGEKYKQQGRQETRREGETISLSSQMIWNFFHFLFIWH